jgi:hypothetical protein
VGFNPPGQATPTGEHHLMGHLESSRSPPEHRAQGVRRSPDL